MTASASCSTFGPLAEKPPGAICALGSLYIGVGVGRRIIETVGGIA
jgi:hypothetical protein